MTIIKAHVKKVADDIKSRSRKSFQRNRCGEKMETEPCEAYLTVKSKFFNS
jgi:hypothetical protein